MMPLLGEHILGNRDPDELLPGDYQATSLDDEADEAVSDREVRGLSQADPSVRRSGLVREEALAHELHHVSATREALVDAAKIAALRVTDKEWCLSAEDTYNLAKAAECLMNAAAMCLTDD
jgi:hypothetical protein